MRSEERGARSECPAAGCKRLHRSLVASTAWLSFHSISRSSLLAPRSLSVLVVLLSLTSISPAIAQRFLFDDIEFWVGAGASRAAFVIDWVEGAAEPSALVWGYRWDGAAKGRDMLVAIVAADPRLYAKVGGSLASPVAVYGLGYDANDDGLFSIDDGTTFDAAGFAVSGAADLGVSNDPGDYYAEGWFAGFWHYGVETPDGANPFDGGNWLDIGVGMANRDLVDGAWDSWTFETSTLPPFTSFAENPVAAPSPFQPGDFNQDGEVEAADYDVWRGAFGSTQSAADANQNGVVDAADYVIWRDNLTASATAAHTTLSIHVPEPATATLLIAAMLDFQFLIRRKLQMNLDERRLREIYLRSSASIRGFLLQLERRV